ncbi:MAG: hypothetical protein ACRC6M_03570 [Microcystaceae cyanobacterium]
MAEITLDSNQLKESLKVIMLELLQENKELFQDFLVEIIEDIAMEKAILEGEKTEIVSEESITELLERKLCS